MFWSHARADRLLLACLHRAIRPTEPAPPQPEGIHWERALVDAERQGVAPLVFAGLRPGSAGVEAPAAIMARLEEQYYRQAALNAHLHNELERLLTTLADETIPVVLLKGAALAELVYGNIALRPMQDVDLLVRPGDLESADRVVRNLGYVPEESYRPAGWYTDQHHHLVPYRSADGRTVVEIHRHILPPTAPLRVPVEDLWRRARRVVVASTPTLVLAPHDLLLHLSLDISCVDRFTGKLRSLCDIAMAIRKYEDEIDWPELLAAARACRGERFVYHSLALARRLIGAAVPDTVLRDLRSSTRGSLLADLFLKVVTRRAVMRYPNEPDVVPGWILARTCGGLLKAEDGWQAIRALRPLDLLSRVVRRVLGQG